MNNDEIILIKKDELASMIKEAVIDAMQALNSVEMKEELTKQEACQYLDCSLSTLNNQIASGQIKVQRIGKYVKINKKELVKLKKAKTNATQNATNIINKYEKYGS